jgi:hypothetical protein
MTYKKSHLRAATDDTLGQDCKHRLQRAEALGTAARQDANANDDGSGEEVRKDKVKTQGAGEKHSSILVMCLSLLASLLAS